MGSLVAPFTRRIETKVYDTPTGPVPFPVVYLFDSSGNSVVFEPTPEEVGETDAYSSVAVRVDEFLRNYSESAKLMEEVLAASLAPSSSSLITKEAPTWLKRLFPFFFKKEKVTLPAPVVVEPEDKELDAVDISMERDRVFNEMQRALKAFRDYFNVTGNESGDWEEVEEDFGYYVPDYLGAFSGDMKKDSEGNKRLGITIFSEAEPSIRAVGWLHRDDTDDQDAWTIGKISRSWDNFSF